jgi:hypothetical protein
MTLKFRVKTLDKAEIASKTPAISHNSFLVLRTLIIDSCHYYDVSIVRSVYILTASVFHSDHLRHSHHNIECNTDRMKHNTAESLYPKTSHGRRHRLSAAAHARSDD